MPSPSHLVIYRTRRVVPACRPHIENGALLVAGTRIIAVGEFTHLHRLFTGRVVDLGERILLPGLINAHCHLEYTHAAGLFEPPAVFSDWARQITRTRQTWTADQFAAAWCTGAQMLLESGVTTVANVQTVHELLLNVLESTPIRVWSFLEVTGVASRANPEAAARTLKSKVLELRRTRCHVGLSPHAPYSTTPALLTALAQLATELDLPVTMHVAESEDEFQMFTRAVGAMYQWLARHDRDMRDCGGITPVQHVLRHWPEPRGMIMVHANCITEEDITLLARASVHVVHCPRSHAYFGHPRFKWCELTAAGVNVCLGTDSLASVRGLSPAAPARLDLFEEMRMFARTYPGVAPEVIVRMVTLAPARALRCEGVLGCLQRNAAADIIALRDDMYAPDPYEVIVQHAGPVDAVMIGGRWVFERDRLQPQSSRTVQLP